MEECMSDLLVTWVRVPVLLSLVLAAVAAGDSTNPFGTSSADGLSGYPFLPSSDVLNIGVLRLQGLFEYVAVKEGGHMMRLPLNAGYGWFENVEVSAGIPLYVSDDVWDESILGNLSVSGAWKYETARGGSALRLSSGFSLPTGSETRDPDAEFFLGAATSTTFRLFRMSAEAKYVLNSKNDLMRFSCGGASYVTGDIVVHGSLSGSTAGQFNLSGGVVASPWDKISVMGTASLGLDGPYDFILSAGAAWTGISF